ncbi:threonine dehydratase [Rhodococcus aetherivorans]|uniref:L-threonine dehydratase biosynthetic IlvA n=1 Tax=Rhodococcus aetherivorans TaxID=191292 RepID=A0ABQ0YRS4_9NOCA|nr:MULTISPECIES: threonine ammonia-lyase IlvA [Rhodococcus]ETT24297.1 Pyridoxal-5'-phosphate-dependent protein beta subunit [Rhodococcus rhodochrous ATCC 21198]NCL74568.1 L-threonine dehydratase biosynthetic IlvA [Rhodococcus sp. YH1]MDV6295034.1 threonine ammonia-lyase IlvA [Rhodococcus aetherivorans]NGP27824.1 threonine ammonia-lyase IlvA [Rhodococcus aetherivorans]OLL16331.1 threonine dehydratase [Rhodococcus sp. M8]
MHLPALSVADIEAAAERISAVVAPTPLEHSERLSVLTGANVYLKREDLTRVRSYKLRGAYNVMAQLSPAEREAGVVTASAGNHAQGVAYACRAMGVMGRIYVPTRTPKQKRDRIRAHGGAFVELIPTGDTFDAAAAAAAEDVARTGATMVAPFDDARTAAGQGTIAREVLDQLPAAPDLVLVPVGGGGCLAGIAAYLHEKSPSTSIVGVEPAGAASMTAALVAGGPVTLPEVDPFVDGAAVKRVGDVPYAVVSRLGAEIVSHANLPLVAALRNDGLGTGPFGMTQVDEGAVCTAMLDLYQNEGIIAEPAGALSVAALEGLTIAPGSTVVCLISGGNNDVSRYGEIIERSLVHRGLKHYFLVDFPQEPGALRRFLDEVLGPDDDITLFEYVKRNNREFGAALVGIELGAADGLSPLLARMSASPIEAQRLEPGSPAYRYLT